MKLSSVLPLIGRLFTPLAMVVFLAYEISSSQQVPGAWQTVVILGAVCTAMGVEVVGILSGHAVERFWRLGDSTRTAVSLLLLGVYTAAGTFILWGTIMVVVPLIAAVLYIVAALVEGVEERVQRDAESTAVRSQFDMEQEALDRQAERDRQAAEAKSKHEEEIARVQAEAQIALAKTQADAEAKRLRAESRKASAEIRKAAQVAAVDSQATAQKSAETQGNAQTAMPYECACGQVYEKPQSYSAHTRHCDVYQRVSANGHAK